MLDLLYHIFNYTIAFCYACIFLLIFSGLLRERAFGRNSLGTATSIIFLTCSLGHFSHALISHAAGTTWEAGIQVILDGWTVYPAVAYLILRRKYGLIIRGPDMMLEYQTQIDQQNSQIKTLREFEQLKDDFLAMASHELRTPLTTIKGYAQYLSRVVAGYNDKKVMQAVKIINQQAERMNNLIGMLLDVSQIQSGKLELQPAPLNLSEFMPKMIEQLQITSTSHHLSLHLDSAPAWVLVDAERLEQVVNNLVGNAIKYSPDADRIEINLKISGPEILIHVSDYGPGIPAEEIVYIFDRFYRSPSVKNSTKVGLGLGLYICSQIIRASDGNLSVISQLNQGSTFTVSLPKVNV